MVEYLCYRCGYVASQRINLKHHLNRKKICSLILGDIGIEDIKKHYNFEVKTMNPNESKMNPTESLKTYSCQFCNKSYSTNSNLHKHFKKCHNNITDHNIEFKNESKNESKMSSQCHPNVIQVSS